MKKFLKYVFITCFIIATFIITLNVKYVQADDVYPFTGITIGDALGVHSEANFKTETEVTQLLYGTQVTVLEAKGSCYKIQYDKDKIGYVSKNYIVNLQANTLNTDVANLETYRDYCDALIKNGFVESYCPYLYYLHSKHPKWIFKADVNSKSLDEIANNELWKNVLQTTNKNYWLSDKPIEGSYYYVTSSVISSFMDPRNSLFEPVVFQFLDLENSKDISNDASLAKVASANGVLKNYYKEFKEAASANGINAIHLMARSQQEGADKVGYGSISGTYTTTYNKFATNGLTLDGYYNFFNIGAWQTSDYTTVGRGLAHAAGYIEKDASCFIKKDDGTISYNDEKCGSLSNGRPWNSPAKAISGGADFIANSYIKKGQNTNYYEKFNVASYGKYDMYTHQYMTAIYAPSSEGSKIYYAYKGGSLLDSAFTFVIPVYQNMTDTIYQPINKDSNSKLASITVDGNVITGFDSDVVEYTYNCVTDKDYVEVSALALVGTSTMTGLGKATFKDGVATVSIEVTAEDGSKTTYKVNVKKITKEKVIAVTDIVNKMGVKISNEYMYQISPGTTVTTLIETVTNNGGTAKVMDANNVNKTSGSLATGDVIVINGTMESKSYKIAIRGDTNGDGNISVLDLLRCQKHILKTINLEGSQYFAADTNFDGNINVLDLLKIQKHVLGSENL